MKLLGELWWWESLLSWSSTASYKREQTPISSKIVTIWFSHQLSSIRIQFYNRSTLIGAFYVISKRIQHKFAISKSSRTKIRNLSDHLQHLKLHTIPKREFAQPARAEDIGRRRNWITRPSCPSTQSLKTPAPKGIHQLLLTHFLRCRVPSYKATCASGLEMLRVVIRDWWNGICGALDDWAFFTFNGLFCWYGVYCVIGGLVLGMCSGHLVHL